MPGEAVLVKLESNERVAEAIGRAAADLDPAGGELVLDFSAVDRIDAAGLKALDSLLTAGAEKSIRISLLGVDVGVYKVLKLMKVTQRASFVN